MRFGPAIVLVVGLCCPGLPAQQSLVASGSMSSLKLPSAYEPATPSPVASVKTPVVPADVVATGDLGLPNTAIYNAVMPELPAAVCTQAGRAVMVRAEMNSYAFSRAQFSRASLKASFQHDNLVKMAHNFVPGQPLPDAPAYVPLTARQKFDLFVRSTHSVDMGVSILTDALISQTTGAYPKFGGGMEGFGQRMGAAAAGEEGASFISGFLFPTLFHQDPRYFRSHQTRIVDRLAYAASRVIIGRSDDGRNVINFSAISGQFAQAAISNAYIPYRNETVSGTLENALAGLSGVAQAQILNEFWPDMKQFVMRHTPGLRDKAPSTESTFTFR
jgi:hypothetical protein